MTRGYGDAGGACARNSLVLRETWSPWPSSAFVPYGDPRPRIIDGTPVGRALANSGDADFPSDVSARPRNSRPAVASHSNFGCRYHSRGSRGRRLSSSWCRYWTACGWRSGITDRAPRSIHLAAGRAPDADAPSQAEKGEGNRRDADQAYEGFAMGGGSSTRLISTTRARASPDRPAWPRVRVSSLRLWTARAPADGVHRHGPTDPHDQ